jgi:glycerate-2-kinase
MRFFVSLQTRTGIDGRSDAAGNGRDGRVNKCLDEKHAEIGRGLEAAQNRMSRR